MALVDTDSPSQPESTPDSREIARLVEGFGLPGVMAEPAAPQAEPAAAPAQPDLSAQIAALQSQLAQIEARQTAPVGPTPADWSAASAQGTLAAFEQLRQRREWEEGQRRAMQPPQMPPDEALLTDPNAIKYAINSQVTHALSAYDAAVRPQLQEAAELRQLLAPMMQQVATSADSQARAMAEQEGIDAETFNRLLPEALRMIESAPGTSPAGRFQMRTDANILLTAVHGARRARGIAPTPAAPPTSIGVTHTAQTGSRNRAQPLPGTDLVEKTLGIKFDPATRQRIGRATALAEYANALPETGA